MRQTLKGDVGVNVVAQVAHIVTTPLIEEPPVFIAVSEEQFRKAYGMRASAPARIALLRLLEEDVTARSLRRLWGDELTFSEDRLQLQIYRWVPNVTLAVVGAWGSALIAALVLLAQRPQSVFAVGVASVVFVALTFTVLYALVVELLPYHIACRIRRIVDQVNEELPDILAAWRSGRRRRTASHHPTTLHVVREMGASPPAMQPNAH